MEQNETTFVEEEITAEAIDQIAEMIEEPDAEPTDEQENAEDLKPDANEIAYLKAELDTLRRELADSRAFYSRLEGECAEFSELYPSVPLSTLPDSIWQSVKKGVPLAAAYALEERKSALAAMKADTVNGENRKMSSGSLKNDQRGDFFTPSEVRAMSPSEVRANYTKIINSMSKWH